MAERETGGKEYERKRNWALVVGTLSLLFSVPVGAAFYLYAGYEQYKVGKSKKS